MTSLLNETNTGLSQPTMPHPDITQFSEHFTEQDNQYGQYAKVRKDSFGFTTQMSEPSRLQTLQDMPVFQPMKHIIFKDEPQVLTMEEIGFCDMGISPVAVTEPFELFSSEAIRMMRSEIFKPEVTRNHSFSSNIAAAQLRGYARKHAPFTYAAWTHPTTVAIISKLAGIDLVPWGDYEIAHINLSAPTDGRPGSQSADDKNYGGEVWGNLEHDIMVQNNKPIVDWHKDSYPFVCVLMLSDCTDMVGGETAIRTGNGEIIRVRGPTEGSAVILQGRYITHQALRAWGGRERITSVTSWRPRSPYVKDDSVLGTVRPVSDLNELYHDFAQYRIEILQQRLQKASDDMRSGRKEGREFDTLGHKMFLQESVEFMQHTDRELVEDQDVHEGSVEGTDIAVTEEQTVMSKH